MPVIGFNFDKIVIEKKNPIKQNVKVKNNMSIKNITEDEVSLSDKTEKILKFLFEFTSEYQPDIGEIKLNGNVLFIDKPEEIKKITSSWKKDKKIPTNLMQQILNTILIKCNIKALALSQELNLPPHIRLPTVNPKVDVNNYIG